MSHPSSFPFRHAGPALLSAALLVAVAGPALAQAPSPATIGGGMTAGSAANPGVFGPGPAAAPATGNGLGGNPNAMAMPSTAPAPGIIAPGTGMTQPLGGTPNGIPSPNGLPYGPVPRPR